MARNRPPPWRGALASLGGLVSARDTHKYYSYYILYRVR